MINREQFFSKYRKEFGSLKQTQVEGIEAILNEWDSNYSDQDIRWLAYILATARHETDATMQPIEEYHKGRHKLYGSRHKMDGSKYYDTDNIFYGRGFVQLTWYENYERAGLDLGLDLIHNPEQAMEPSNAAKILIKGMVEGWFTTKHLSTYFSDTRTNPINARAIVNGKDRAGHIADLYYQTINCLQ